MTIKLLVLVAAFGFVLSDKHGENHHHSHHPQPYHFGYDVKDHHGSHYRKEQGDGHGNVKGSYGYTDHHGIHREVHYTADKSGFRAEIKTNEPGTANQDPAHVKIHSHASHHHHPQQYQEKHQHKHQQDKSHQGHQHSYHKQSHPHHKHHQG